MQGGFERGCEIHVQIYSLFPAFCHFSSCKCPDSLWDGAAPAPMQGGIPCAPGDLLSFPLCLLLPFPKVGKARQRSWPDILMDILVFRSSQVPHSLGKHWSHRSSLDFTSTPALTHSCPGNKPTSCSFGQSDHGAGSDNPTPCCLSPIPEWA